MDSWSNNQSNNYGQQYDATGQYQQQGQWGSQMPQQNWNDRPYGASNDEVVGVGEWVLMYIICLIPCLNVIMLFVWAFGGGAKASKRNYCRAMLIIIAVMFVLMFLLIAFVGAVGVSVSSMY